jgi:hypothetical protein
LYGWSGRVIDQDLAGPERTVEHVVATMRLVLLAVTAVVQAGLGIRPLVVYEHAPAAYLAFAALALVTLTCAWWVIQRKPLPNLVVVAGVAVVLVASVVATAALPPDSFFGAAHWSFGLIGWHLLLLLMDRVTLVIVALATHDVISVVQFVLAGQIDRADVGAAGVVLLGVTSFQVGMLVITRVLHRSARQAAEVAVEREHAATRAALAEQWERDLRTAFAGQLGATLPLLADLADGALDARDEDTRLRCALAATQLRRLFAENDDVPDPLVHEVSACVDLAQRRGVVVSLAVSGEPVQVPPDVRRELTEPLVVALSAARARARVSLLRTAEEVRVAVVADAGGGLGTTSGRVDVESGTYGEHTRTEARWRTS